MSFIALVFALLIEQVHPLSEHSALHRWTRQWAQWLSRTLDAGNTRLAWLTWGLAVGVPALVAVLVHWCLLGWFGWPLAMLWSMGVLYVTLGFRQFSHHFTDIRDALSEGDEALARQRLADWMQVEVGALPRTELLRHVIEHSVLCAHRHVFGVLAWFSVLAALGLGPAGAVIYRLSDIVWRNWRIAGEMQDWVSGVLQTVSRRAWHAVDWVPSRLTAIAFAVVGNFEEAIDCWRHHAQRFPDDNDGVVLAATAGAINVRLGGEALQQADASMPWMSEAVAEPQDSESTPGQAPENGHLASLVGLVWRTVVLWLILLALLTVARLLG
jgi:adenosylcobinamide-phosphate synthase